MKDIDFDELDRAVNSLVGKPTDSSATKSDEPKTDTSVPSSATDASASDSSKTNDDSAISKKDDSSVVTPEISNHDQKKTVDSPKPAKVPPAIRRSGRFMDVMHPSSDMGSSETSSNTDDPPISFTAKNIKPLNDHITPDPIADNDPQNIVGKQLSTVASPDPEALVSSPDTTEKEWPDPLELFEKNQKEAENSSNDTSDLSEDRSDPNLDEPVKTDSLESPFLADAKVEKRPLGAFSVDKSPEPAAKSAVLDGSDDAELDAGSKSNDPQITPETLPPELAKDIVSVEAGNIEESPVSHEKAPSNKGLSAPPIGSIPQQYKTKPQNNDVAHSPIFDTTDYHKPLQPSSKNKSPIIKWAALLLGLAIFGAAAVFALYYFVGF